MPNALSLRHGKNVRDQEDELSSRITESFTVVTVGDLIQIKPFSTRKNADIQALIKLMQSADITLANNENTVVDRLTYRGPISHMESDAAVADDWAKMGIAMVSKANNHTWDNGEPGIIQNFEQLRRVGIEYVGTDYNLEEARLARFRETPKGTVGFIGAYAEVADYSQLFGLPGGEHVIVTPTQLAELRAIRDSIVARRVEVPNGIDVPDTDPEGSVLVFGRIFKLASTSDGVNEEAAAIKKRLEHHLNSKGPITYKNNTLGLKVYHGVTVSQLATLRAIAGDKGSGNTLDAFGVHFKVTPGTGEFSYDTDLQEERDILREVRTGKQFADFEAFTIHWHQNRFSFQKYSFDHYPPDFEIQFAHKVIDNGADLFFAHGVHTLKGVEIYKGRPIFYGLSNYIFHQQQFRSWRDDAVRPHAPLTGPLLGEGEINEARWAWLHRPENLETILASSRYENGKLAEVLLYPVDLGRTPRPSSDIGTPRTPAPEIARDILERVAVYSEPFGTKITIENGVGVISIQ